AYVQLDRLPLTPNGKLDRKALPAPDATAYAAPAYEAPQGEIEHTIAAIWRDLLGLESIGRHDNFFALGGHSLLAVQMVSRLNHAGIENKISDLFSNPILMSLAAHLKNEVYREDFNGLIPFRKEGNEIPLFILYEASGSVLYAKNIEKFLRAGMPIYGIECPVDFSIDTIQGMAA
ncbi:phosphopantetheine-binding protein, partial [Xanthomonas sp. MUS 060]|uniref:phosphopantetheine-binding protein n=1 Tax=Xanthomonas sp. MUS 060 TaxID=1588031 RepID=UPI0005F2B2D6